MTLKGHRNHYNIKFLRGYGISISIKNNKIILKNGSHDITGEREKEEWFVTKIPYEKIVISGKGYVSTEAISLLSKKNINVLLTIERVQSNRKLALDKKCAICDKIHSMRQDLNHLQTLQSRQLK